MAHILIVDDEEVLRDLLAQILETMGHTCDEAANGREGCRLVASREYDLIITDIRMPEMGGLDFLRKIESYVESRTPCMIITALADEPSVAVKAVRLACDFLSKPFEMKTIQEAVQRALVLREAWKFRQSYQEQLEKELVAKENELQQTYDGVLASFAAFLEGKDDGNTLEHCLRVRRDCTQVALSLGLTDSEALRNLQLGAVLHDIGKHRVPDEILNKPGPLTPEEWVEMRRHPEYGAEFVKNIPFLEGAAEVILNHHERWDGGGYPRGLREEEIPLAARIFFVVDTFDTILSKRCYKDPRSPAEALEELRRNAGTQFDPQVIEAFERVYDKIAADWSKKPVVSKHKGNGHPHVDPAASEPALRVRRMAVEATRRALSP
jgi:putative nucleotidyltransferase with HDIG domain